MAKQPSTPSQVGSPHRSLRQEMEVPDGYLVVGYVVGVHGLHGETKVELHTDFPERFKAGTVLFAGEARQRLVVRGARPHKGHLLLSFDGVADRRAAEQLRNAWLLVDEADAVELEEDEYWVHEIIGLAVETETGHHLGHVKDVIFTGANDVYVVGTAPEVNAGRELLLPAIDEVVQRIDLEAGVMTVRLQPGAIEE